MTLAPGSRVLDIPTGTGRHALLFAELGYDVTVVDIDDDLVRTAASLSAGHGVTLDATAPLPFPLASFDAVVVVDFVDARLLSQMGTITRPGGWLISESYSARGGNWRQLLPPGETVAIVTQTFDIIQCMARSAGQTKTEAEAIKILGRRR